MSSLHSYNYLQDLYKNKEYPGYFILFFTKIRFIAYYNDYREEL